MIKICNYINGELIPPKQNQYIDNPNPATGEIFSQIPDSDTEDVKIAYQAAANAFDGWSKLNKQKRSNILLKIAELIDANIDKLAKGESTDNGKPLLLAKSVDIPRASANFRFYATAILHQSSEVHHTDENSLNYTLRKPIGVAGCISPWNLPLYLFTWKIAPALAAGCTVVAKPSEITPYTAFLLSELCIEAGLPKGVLNIVHGYGAKVGGAIVSHPDIKAISFTGGTKTGETIARKAAPMFKKLSLELGGKNPNIIFDDCDFEKALKTTMLSSFANQGQICLCGSRVFIQKGIYEKFKNAMVEKTKQLKIGNPLEESTKIGAVVSQDHKSKVLSYIELAKEEGGAILCGGMEAEVPDLPNGNFIYPTIIEGLSYDCRTNQEEIFGPVVTLTPFETEEEVLKYANSVKYGLSSTIWTQDINKAQRVSQQIEAGIVWVNCWLVRDLRTPFGGIKQSGVGREGGFYALNFFTEPKNVCIQI